MLLVHGGKQGEDDDDGQLIEPLVAAVAEDNYRVKLIDLGLFRFFSTKQVRGALMAVNARLFWYMFWLHAAGS